MRSPIILAQRVKLNKPLKQMDNMFTSSYLQDNVLLSPWKEMYLQESIGISMTAYLSAWQQLSRVWGSAAWLYINKKRYGCKLPREIQQ